MPLGESERMFAILREAERLAEALDDQQRLASISNHLSNYFVWMGAPDRAVAASQRALTHAMACGDATSQVVIRFNLAWAYVTMGDYGRAIDLEEFADSSKTTCALGAASGGGFMSVLCRNVLAWMLAEREHSTRVWPTVKMVYGLPRPPTIQAAWPASITGSASCTSAKGVSRRPSRCLKGLAILPGGAHWALFPRHRWEPGLGVCAVRACGRSPAAAGASVAQAASMGHMGQQAYRLVH